MKVFHCDRCDNLVFFENSQCLRCSRPLAYLPDRGVIWSFDSVAGDDERPSSVRVGSESYRLCKNYTDHAVCNWAVAASDDDPYCQSCRLTRVIPNLEVPGNTEAWGKLEVAKRRLIYTLLGANLPLVSKEEQPEGGLAFEFLADVEEGEGPRVLTGHDNGLITVNIAEADDAERERRRTQLQEPYRTLLGHFRHEVGHYYWDRLIRDGDQLEACREIFGDERTDYSDALARHYKEGPPADWQERFISSYATMHPWEDWAETWAHYLHMTDTLETAIDCGVEMRPKRTGAPALEPPPRGRRSDHAPFEAMVERWHALGYLLNNLNRSMGLPDGYPFVISPAVIEKLRFVHEVVGRQGS